MSPGARALAASLLAIVAAAACGKDEPSTGDAAGAAGSGVGGSSNGGGNRALGFPCGDPQPQVLDGKPTGMVACADGTLTRVGATQCRLVDPNPRPGCALPVGGAAGASASGGAAGAGDPSPRCTAACDDAPYGAPRGIPGPGGTIYSESTCLYACANDADCPPGRSCACDGTGNGVCVKADCLEAAGCPTDETCRLAQTGFDCGQTEPTLTCVGVADECLEVSDCGPNAQRCVASGAQDPTLRCLGGAGCGRPILVAEMALLAPLERSGAWSARRLV